MILDKVRTILRNAFHFKRNRQNEKDAFLRSSLDNLMEGCQILNHDWIYLYLNATADKHNRRDRKELLGRKYVDMWPGIENTRVYQLIRDCLENRNNHHLENQFIFPDGTVGWYDLSIQAIPEGVFILSIDITERKQAEKALSESESKYRLISDNTEDWIYWIDNNRSVKYISPACQKITGYSPEEFMTDSGLILRIVVPEDKSLIESHHRNLKDSNEYHEVEFRIITKSGKIRWINHSCRPLLDEDGTHMGRIGTNRDITEKKTAREALLFAHDRLRRFFDSDIVGLVIANPDGKITEANGYYLNLLGFTREEFNAGMLDWRSVTPPEWISKDEIAIAELRRSGICTPYEKEYFKRDGSRVSVFIADAILPGEQEQIAGFIIDITERKKIEAKLKQSNTLMKNTQSMAKIGSWEWNIENNTMFWTEETYRIHDLDVGEIEPDPLLYIKKSENCYLPGDRKTIMDAFNRCVRTGESYDLEFPFTTTKGRQLWIRTSGQAEWENNRIVKIIGNISDITERKQYELLLKEKTEEVEAQNEEYLQINEELSMTNAELFQAKERAEESDRLKTAFLQNMSHEIRTPMNAIMGFSDLLLQNHDDSKKIDKYAQIINQRSADLLDIINGVLDIAKIESGQVPLTLEESHLHDLFSEIKVFFNEYQKRSNKQHIEFTVKENSEVDKLTFLVDRVKLKQILINLINNAFKFTEIGSITVGCSMSNSYLKFYVSDTGIGIPEEKQGIIFDRFVQLEQTTFRFYGGTGLGLSIVKGLVDALGGNIWVESKPGQGARFSFAIPIKKKEEISEEQSTETSFPGVSETL